MSSLIDITEVNSIDAEQFEWMFGNVIELCAGAAAKVYKRRPFNDTEALCDAFSSYLDELSEIDKVTILNLHPDLAGRLTSSGNLTKESADEQKCAGLQELTADQRDTIVTMNEKYKIKFGFPFIICARENKVQSIIEGLKKRYYSTRQQEIHTAIEEVKKICKLRILDIVFQ